MANFSLKCEGAFRAHFFLCLHFQLDSAEDEQEKERISVEEANRPLPVPKDGFSFETLIRNRDEVEHFKEFLNKKHTRGRDHSILILKVFPFDHVHFSSPYTAL